MATARIKPTIGPIKSPAIRRGIEPWSYFPGGYEAWKKRKESLPPLSPRRTNLSVLIKK